MEHCVSVIMCVYNEQEIWLREAIESILSQTYNNIEFIIILDNPHNYELKEIINEYSMKDSRIKLIVNEKNIGLIKSLNKGLGISKGKYIARLMRQTENGNKTTLQVSASDGSIQPGNYSIV